jgi:hypothetical protein
MLTTDQLFARATGEKFGASRRVRDADNSATGDAEMLDEFGAE